MVRKFVTATVSAALGAMSVLPGPAAAQDRYTGYEAPRGATATVNLRVPMGGRHAGRPSYGLTLGYGQAVSTGLDGRTTTRSVDFADLRFSDGGLRRARVAQFDLANLDHNRRMNLVGGNPTIWFVAGAVAAGAVACFVVWDCFGDDNDSNN